jgi:hypothetical protein
MLRSKGRVLRLARQEKDHSQFCKKIGFQSVRAHKDPWPLTPQNVRGYINAVTIIPDALLLAEAFRYPWQPKDTHDPSMRTLAGRFQKSMAELVAGRTGPAPDHPTTEIRKIDLTARQRGHPLGPTQIARKYYSRAWPTADKASKIDMVNKVKEALRRT